MTSHSNASEDKLEFIDALRGIALLLVIAFHVGLDLSEAGVPLSAVFKGGQYGVQLFFVASAFTLCLSHSRRQQEPFGNSRFFVRRFFRIAPMYYLGLLHYGLIRSLHSGSWPATGYNTLSVLSNVTFTHGFLPSAINYVVPGGWSIACEMLFYTSFPVVMLWVTTWQRALVLLCVTLILNQAAASLSFQDSFQSWRETEPAFFYYWLPNQAPVFACGVLIYFIYQAVSRRSPVIRGYIAGAAWIIFSVLAFTAILLLLKKIPGMYTHSLMPIFCGLTFGMWLLALSLAPGRIVVNPITTLFGFYSYGGYLCHFAYLWLCMYYLENAPWRGASPLLQWGIMFALVAGATLVTSIALHYAVERPGIQAGRWVIRRFLSPVKVASDSGLTS